MRVICNTVKRGKTGLLIGYTHLIVTTFDQRNEYAHAFYQDGILLIVAETRLRIVGRLASDRASALQLRRMKDELGSSFDRVKEYDLKDLNSRLNELMSSSISRHLDQILLGETA
jgi:hypothetical protein